MKVWILTSSYNDYDQHGDYFEGVFAGKPTREQLVALKLPEYAIEHVLTGKGAWKDEYVWYQLSEQETL